MIWLLWRRRRASTLLIAALAGALVVALVAIRVSTAAQLRAAGVPDGCFAVPTEACRAAALATPRPGGPLWGLMHTFLLVVPLLLGLLAGTGLFGRELEERTLLFTLSQSESRARWCGVTLLAGGLPALVAAGVLGALVPWAFQPLDLVAYPFSSLETPVFESSGVVIVGYTLLAFAVAVAAGVVARSSLASIVVTVPVYGIVMYLLARRIRPHYLPPEQVPVEGALNFSDARGELQDVRAWIVDYEPYLGGQDDGPRLIEYQPDDRYWLFQAIELGILLVLAALPVVVALRGLSNSRDGIGKVSS